MWTFSMLIDFVDRRLFVCCGEDSMRVNREQKYFEKHLSNFSLNIHTMCLITLGCETEKRKQDRIKPLDISKLNSQSVTLQFLFFVYLEVLLQTSLDWVISAMLSQFSPDCPMIKIWGFFNNKNIIKNIIFHIK